MTAGNSPAPLAIDTAPSVDPSMEEILASIRKIIADDDVSAGARKMSGPVPSLRVPDAPRAEDVRPEATVATLVPPPPAPPRASPLAQAARMVEPALSSIERVAPPDTRRDPSPVVDFARPTPASLPEEPALITAPVPANDPVQATSAEADLVSTVTTTSVASAFQALSASVALNSREVVDAHVRDLLRPMLKTWLDDNLPTIVERLVRVEIERVARGGR
jgi:cell pole-organizing protein PopZ